MEKGAEKMNECLNCWFMVKRKIQNGKKTRRKFCKYWKNYIDELNGCDGCRFEDCVEEVSKAEYDKMTFVRRFRSNRLWRKRKSLNTKSPIH